MRLLWIGVLSLAIGCGSPEISVSIDAVRLAEHVRVLSSDEFGGRGPGTPGEDRTVDYLAEQFEAAGAAPAAEDESYFQTVPLVGVESLATTTATWDGGALAWLDDVVAVNHQQLDSAAITAEVVYVGRGIVAPEFGWDDYKDVDVQGKLVLLFTNEPPSNDDAFFGGRGLTYYGRWTFKYVEALRHGAAGVLIVHTDETAGYLWSVVRNSWGGKNPYVKLGDDEPALVAAGWIQGPAALSILQQSAATRGKTVEEILGLANEKDFRPIALDASATLNISSRVTPLNTRNVLAKIPGANPAEAVLYTAHWDHLGTNDDPDGDGIYNGAVDNATGCAALIELARAFAQLPEPPARTILFAAVGAEEGGLRGSEYYAQHPVIPVGKTAVDLNYDGLLPLPETRDAALPGYERTTLKPLVEQLAAEFDYTLNPEAHPEQGYYYRSDHFSLAKAGVPAFSLKLGTDVIGQPAGWGEEQEQEYRDNRYHQPADEFDPSWDFAGLAKLVRFGFELGRRVAEQPDLPTWVEGDEFLPARERSWGDR